MGECFRIITSGGPLHNHINYQSLTKTTGNLLRFISRIGESVFYIFSIFRMCQYDTKFSFEAAIPYLSIM